MTFCLELNSFGGILRLVRRYSATRLRYSAVVLCGACGVVGRMSEAWGACRRRLPGIPAARILPIKSDSAAKSPAKPRSRPGFAPKYGCIVSSGVVLYSQETGPTSRFRHKRPGPESRIGGHSGQVAVHQVRAWGSGMGVGDGFRGETFTGAGSPKGGSVTGTVSAYDFFYLLTRDYIRGAVCKPPESCYLIS